MPRRAARECPPTATWAALSGVSERETATLHWPARFSDGIIAPGYMAEALEIPQD